MPLGSTKSSRIKICFFGLLFSALVMSSPFALTAYFEKDFVVFSFLAWVGLFLLGTFLAVLVSQIAKIDAEGKGTAKLLGFEMPVEIRGISVLLLGFYALLVVFYLATDLEKQLSIKSVDNTVEDLEENIADLQNIVNTFNAIHSGKHVEDVQMLKLSYHCGDNEQKEKVTEWNRYNSERDVADENSKKSSDKPFPVGKTNYVYRVKYKVDDSSGPEYERSPLRVQAKLDREGVLTARIYIAEPAAYEELWRFCIKSDEDIYAQDPDEIIENKANPRGG